MRRSLSFMALTGLVMLQVGCSGASSNMPAGLAPASDVLQSLSGAIPGLSFEQAAIGAGSLLGLAEANMTPDTFDELMDDLPGAGTLLSHARAAGLPNTDELTNLAGLRGVMSDSGITAAQQSDLPSAFGALVSEHTSPDLGRAFMNAIS